MELIVDGHSLNHAVMTDKSVMRNWLLKMAEFIGMKVIGTPHVVSYPWPGSDDDKALSGDCFLAESSIMVHTYPEEKKIHLNIFSCREFDYEEACKYMKETLGLEYGTGLLLQRGLDVDSGIVPELEILAKFEL